MPERVHCFGISRDAWRAAILALINEGWAVEKGGGLDHSWAVLERDGMRVEMEYDIWAEGEVIIGAADAAKLKALHPATALIRLGVL